MALRGDIKTFSLSAIGRMIHEEAKTGILKVTSGNQATRIYFKNGGIVFLSGNVAEDLSLGSLLKANGLIDEERLQQSLQRASAAGKRLGVVLIEQGYISKERLVRILHYQFKEAVTTMLTWQQGEFDYSDGLGDYVEDIHLTIDPIRLVAEAQKWKEFRHHIPNDQVVFQIKNSDRKLPPLESDGALRVMLLIDGQRNVNQIISTTGLPRLAVYKALTTLVTQGIIASKTPAQRQPSHADLNWYAIVELFFKLLERILASMTAELGRQRAVAFLSSCLQQHPAYAHGLNVFVAEDDLETNLAKLREEGASMLQRVERQEMITGFLAVVIAYLRKGYQVLGFKVAQQMIDDLIEKLKQVPITQERLAQTIIEFLKPYSENEKLLRNSRQPTVPAPVKMQAAKAASSSNIRHLEKISASTVITFYHQVFKSVVRDLEQEVGSQGTNLFQRLAAGSDGDDTLLATFDLQASSADNIKSLHEHISIRGYKLEKETLVRAFQNLLAALLHEQKRLLGPKATLASLLNLEKNLSQIDSGAYRPLGEHLIGFVKHLTAQLGV